MTASAATPSRWVKCISTQGNVRGIAIQATEVVREIVGRHKLKDQGARGLGEAVMGALLISSYCKDGERVNLNIQSEGMFRQALVEAKPDGTVRGYLSEREAGSFEVDRSLGPWAAGTMSVLRTRDKERQQPYIGTVPLVTGHLAKDLTFYWAQSEQIPSAVGLAVTLDANGNVVSAGGFQVQVMPGASTEEVKMIESHINEIESLSAKMGDFGDPVSLLSQIFQSTAFVILEDKPLSFACNCSLERAYRALALIGPRELRAILLEEDHASVHCDFCAVEYKIGREEIEKMITAAEAAAMEAAAAEAKAFEEDDEGPGTAH